MYGSPTPNEAVYLHGAWSPRFLRLTGWRSGWRYGICVHDGPSAIRSAVSSGSSVNYYSMAPAYEHRLTRPAPKIQTCDFWDSNRRFDLMCRPAFNMCYGSFGPELSGEQPFQCQPAEVHPKGEV